MAFITNEKGDFLCEDIKDTSKKRVDTFLSKTLSDEYLKTQGWRKKIKIENPVENATPKVTQPAAPVLVFGVNLDWQIVSAENDLSSVMTPDECRFIGTNAECFKFIVDNKPKAKIPNEDLKHNAEESKAFDATTNTSDSANTNNTNLEGKKKGGRPAGSKNSPKVPSKNSKPKTKLQNA